MLGLFIIYSVLFIATTTDSFSFVPVAIPSSEKSSRRLTAATRKGFFSTAFAPVLSLAQQRFPFEKRIAAAAAAASTRNEDSEDETIRTPPSTSSSSSQSSSSAATTTIPPFVIREMRDEDIGFAAQILYESFLVDDSRGRRNFVTKWLRRNFVTKWLERMNYDYLVLKLAFRYGERSDSMQCFLVACCHHDGASTPRGTNAEDGRRRGDNDEKKDDDVVIGICEVDNRHPEQIDPAPRPFVSNLAVSPEFRRMGVATSLLKRSEDVVRDRWEQRRLYLQVTDDNSAAIEMYTKKCGFMVLKEPQQQPSSDRRKRKKKRIVLLLGKDV